MPLNRVSNRQLHFFSPREFEKRDFGVLGPKRAKGKGVGPVGEEVGRDGLCHTYATSLGTKSWCAGTGDGRARLEGVKEVIVREGSGR